MKVYSNERGLRGLKDGVSFENYKTKYPSAIEVKIPCESTLSKWASDCICKCPDGCRTEPDGHCEHGYPSWLLILGYI
jgi:hypothetical protein